MSYTIQLEGKKGAIGIVPKPSGEHISSLYVGIHAILA